MNDTILETKNLCKRFKKQDAVLDISIGVKKNSIYGLLGPNGAGKSTLLKMITGMLKPTLGEIYFNGHKWSRKDLRYIGSLIEDAPLYENLSARENLKVRTTVLGLPDSRIDEVLKIVELESTGRKKAGQFSMGMKQRLGIAIALLNNPQLLILDEPTNGLDPIGIQDLRKLIRSFPKKGITVILSSHMLSEVEQIADYIGIISGGVLGFEGKLEEGTDLEKLFMDIVTGLSIGGDDYISKPFGINELRARVTAHLRREHREKQNAFSISNVKFNMISKEAYYDNKLIPFTKSEYNICEILAMNHGQVFSKERIYESIFGFEGNSDLTAIVEHIKNIRSKFRKIGINPIETVWGIGYKWK